MTLFVCPNFQGLAPRFADRLLDPTQASFVTNLKPGNGDLRGFRSLKFNRDLGEGGPFRRVIRFYRANSDDVVIFKSIDVNAAAVKSPLAQDAFDRVYFTEAGFDDVRVTTLDDLEAGDPSMPAGVPRPTAAPTVAEPSGTGDIRAYVYTFQNGYGAESSPSDPTIKEGATSGTWTISGFSTAPAGAIKINIYHSASGEETSGNYYRVGQVTLPGSSFADTMPVNVVPLQPELSSVGNDPPPDGLQGLCRHSSGALAAFNERTVYFSKPYLPHAWPAENAYPVGYDIVGIAPLLNYIVVLTKGRPYLLVGDTPASVAIIDLPDVEPCLSQRSIVVMAHAVMFASPNGLCSISQNGVARATNELLTMEEFVAYKPDDIVAAGYGSYYVAFYEPNRGFVVALPPYEPVAFVPLDRYSAVTGLDTDDRSGLLFITQGARVSIFDGRGDNRFPTTWRSKEFIATQPLNLGAVQLLFRKENTTEDQQELIDAYYAYNSDRYMDGPLDTFDMYPIGGDASFPEIDDLDPILSGLPPVQPLGGDPLYDPLSIFGDEALHFTLLADGDVVFTKDIRDEKVHSMPEGYKATRFYAEVAGSAKCQRIIMAETRRECKSA